MKVEPNTKFAPITVTFETEAEAALFMAFVGPASNSHMIEALKNCGYSYGEAKDAAESYSQAFSSVGAFVKTDNLFRTPVTDY